MMFPWIFHSFPMGFSHWSQIKTIQYIIFPKLKKLPQQKTQPIETSCSLGRAALSVRKGCHRRFWIAVSPQFLNIFTFNDRPWFRSGGLLLRMQSPFYFSFERSALISSGMVAAYKIWKSQFHRSFDSQTSFCAKVLHFVAPRQHCRGLKGEKRKKEKKKDRRGEK